MEATVGGEPLPEYDTGMLQRPRRLLLVVALACTALARAVLAAPLELRDGFGIHIEQAQSIGGGQLAIRVSTAALQHPVDVRILLPDEYESRPTKRYPVLYLFHGTSGRGRPQPFREAA